MALDARDRRRQVQAEGPERRVPRGGRLLLLPGRQRALLLPRQRDASAFAFAGHSRLEAHQCRVSGAMAHVLKLMQRFHLIYYISLILKCRKR